ncbi:MAG: hypothetical protein Kow0077_10080 [Anaerolineae bacterium]
MAYFTPSEAPIHETKRLPVLPPRQIIGRNRELGAAYAQIRAGMPVMLHGPSGVGKSALAAMIATAYTTFKGGVLWWSVPQDDLPQLIARLGRAYGDQSITTSADPVSQRERAAILLKQGHNPLVVLDDLRDFDAAREFIRRVAPAVPLIITSRERASGPWIPFEVEPLASEDAQSLLMQSARYSEIPDGTRRAVADLCDVLGNVPLSLVVAGRHLAVTGQQPHDLLEAVRYANVPTYDAALAVVFEQLSDALKGVLLNLGATFAGRASTELLEALQLAPRETVERVMGMLASYGLAQALPQHDDLPPGYAIHPRTHALAYAQLENSGRALAARARVHEALLAFLDRHAAPTRENRAALVDEMPNLLGLARFAAEHGEWGTVERIATALENVFGETGMYAYEIGVLERLLVAQEDAPAPAESAPADEAFEMPESMEEPDEEAYAVEEESEAQTLQTTLTDFVEDGLEVEDAGADFFDALVPSEDEAAAWQRYDETESEAGVPEVTHTPALASEPEAARLPEEVMPADEDEWFEEDEDEPFFEDERFDAEQEPEAGARLLGDEAYSLEQLLRMSREARQSGDRLRLADTLLQVGRAWLERNDLEQAKAVLDEALTIFQEQNSQAGMLDALEALAGVGLESGALDDAVVYATRAENLAAQGGDPVRLGHIQALLGDIRLELGELDEAVETYIRAIEALQAGRDEVSLGVVQAKLGATHMDRGEYTRAVTMLSSAARIFAQAGLDEYEARVLGNLGAAYGQLGQWAEAENYHSRALAIARRLGDHDEQERQLANLGYAAQAQQKWDAMLAYYRAALDLGYRTGNQEWQLRYLDALGRILIDQAPRVAQGIQLLEEAERIAPDPERARWLNRARKRLERLQMAGVQQEPVPESTAAWATGM